MIGFRIHRKVQLHHDIGNKYHELPHTLKPSHSRIWSRITGRGLMECLGRMKLIQRKVNVNRFFVTSLRYQSSPYDILVTSARLIFAACTPSAMKTTGCSLTRRSNSEHRLSHRRQAAGALLRSSATGGAARSPFLSPAADFQITLLG